MSNPSWPNHKSVFNSAGLEVREYAYYDAENHTLDFDALINSLNEAQAGDADEGDHCRPQAIEDAPDWTDVAILEEDAC